jgi:hypothetical protein
MRGRLPLLATLVALGAVFVGGGAGGQAREGGTFRVAPRALDTIDPALSGSPESVAQGDTAAGGVASARDDTGLP